MNDNVLSMFKVLYFYNICNSFKHNILHICPAMSHRYFQLIYFQTSTQSCFPKTSWICNVLTMCKYFFFLHSTNNTSFSKLCPCDLFSLSWKLLNWIAYYGFWFNITFHWFITMHRSYSIVININLTSFGDFRF